MNSNKIIFLLWVMPVLACAQLSDQTWLGGNNEFPGVAGYGHVRILFQGGVQALQTNLAFNFESTEAAAVKPDGEILFYTNGCAISNRLHQVMPNGWGLSPSNLQSQVCPDIGNIAPQGAMVLPMPGDTNRYYILHMAAWYDTVRKLKIGPLYATLIDMRLDNGLGDVVSKNMILKLGDFGNFTAIRHGNGRDWWILAPEFGNKRWYRWLLDPTGITAVDPYIGPDLPLCEHYAQTATSSDGSMVANWGDCYVSLWQFDRCSGNFSDRLELHAPSHWVLGGGLAFSPSGRYLYATSHNVLFRADLEASMPKLDTMRYSYDPYNLSPYYVPGNSFHYLINGPDGKIYGCLPSRAKRFQVIDQPDGDAINKIDFKPNGIDLPVTNVRSFPYYPNYRLKTLANSPCDSLGIVAVQGPQETVDDVRCFPNPSNDRCYFRISGAAQGQAADLYLRDSHGKLVYQLAFYADHQDVPVTLGNLSNGIYFWSVVMKNGAMYRGKVIKAE
jgi:hypothetical protein